MNAYRNALADALKDLEACEDRYEGLLKEWRDLKVRVGVVSEALQVYRAGRLGEGDWADCVVRALKEGAA